LPAGMDKPVFKYFLVKISLMVVGGGDKAIRATAS
jgi:hypothetical protein